MTYTLDETIVWVGKFLENKRKNKRKEMTDFVIGLTRTYTPIVIGALVAWLITKGIQIDVQTQAGLVVALTGFLQALYYTAIRLVEKKYPQVGILLGKAKTPTY